ncbi:MAG TPA: Ig-like domain-containing protein, partial [Propionibacteriaceae bacterium]|nr:Ig-like domain-containing protein [Propionibacteriaceae bacterium]
VSDQITETTLAELGEPGGVGPGCTGTAEPNNLISGYLEPVNIASGDITLSGTAREGVAGVSVAVGALPAKAATLSTNTTGVKTWTVPVTKAELQTLPDGNIAITPSFDGLPGTTRTMLKDMVAPLAPTATPPAGSYAGTQNVTLNKPAGEASSKTHWEIGSATTVTDPDAASAVYTAQIAVSATQTIKARVIDPAGNLGAVATFAYRIGTPPAVPTGVTATETAGGVRIGWSPVSGAANYNVYRSTSTTTPVNPTPLASTATSYVNTGLANGSYSYVVRSVSNTGVESANSATVTATVAPPTVTTRTPASGAVGASAAGNVTATFNEAMTGVSGTTFTLKTAAGAAVAASVSYNTSTRVATLDPTATLLAGTTYTATLTGGATAIRDAGGNALATTSWTFTTDPGPRVTSTTPYNGATGVGVANNIMATFDEAVTGVTGTTFTLKNAAGTTIGGAVSYNATTRVATFNPTNNMTLDTRYTATLTSGIRDAAGNPMALRTWTFMAGVPPTVTSRAPLANATGASKTANVTATFSEAVTGVSGTTFTLKSSAGATVSATVTYNSTTRTASLDPAVTLTGSTKYTATLTGGASLIRDLAGNMLGTNSWSFTTAP